MARQIVTAEQHPADRFQHLALDDDLLAPGLGVAKARANLFGEPARRFQQIQPPVAAVDSCIGRAAAGTYSEATDL